MTCQFHDIFQEFSTSILRLLRRSFCIKRDLFVSVLSHQQALVTSTINTFPRFPHFPIFLQFFSLFSQFSTFPLLSFTFLQFSNTCPSVPLSFPHFCLSMNKLPYVLRRYNLPTADPLFFSDFVVQGEEFKV